MSRLLTLSTTHIAKIFNRDVNLAAGARLMKDETVLIDADGNIDAPVSTTNLTTSGDTTVGDTSADALTINATTTASAPVTVGVDDTGHDVKFFGATSGKSLLWDESADKLIVTGATDLLGNTQQTGTLTVGVDGTGHDVKMFGDTTNKFAVWDQSADDLILADAVALQLGGDESTADGFKLEFDGTDTLALNALTANDKFSVGATVDTDTVLNGANGSVTLDASADTLAIAGLPTTLTTTLTVGVDDTGHDVKFFGATAGKSLLWDESADELIVTGEATVTSADASALAVGLNGATNPALQVDASTASSATGIKVKSAAAAGGIAVSAVSSGTDESLTIDAKGAGTISLNATGTGNIVLGRAATGVSTSLTGGNTLKNATAVPATAGAVAAGVPITMYDSSITIEVTSDAPTHTRPKGSLCINTGGSSGSTRMYVNTDGAGTWTAFTTAA